MGFFALFFFFSLEAYFFEKNILGEGGSGVV